MTATRPVVHQKAGISHSVSCNAKQSRLFTQTLGLQKNNLQKYFQTFYLLTKKTLQLGGSYPFQPRPKSKHNDTCLEKRYVLFSTQITDNMRFVA